MTTFRIESPQLRAYTEKLWRAPAAFRELRLDMMRFATAQAIANITMVYWSEPQLGGTRAQPTAYTGKYGSLLSRCIHPSGQFATVTSGAEYATIVEEGAGPRLLGPEEYMAIEEWARNKMGITDKGRIKRIINRIATVGITPRRLLFESLDANTPRGRQFHQMIEAEALRLIDEFARESL